MSIINDALKKAQASLEKSSKKKPAPEKKTCSSTEVPETIKGSAKKKKAWYKTIIALISIFFFIIGILLTVLLFLMNESNQLSNKSTTRPSSVSTPKLKPTVQRNYSKGELVLSGITSIGSKNAAIINNDVYQVGEEVNGFIIEAINFKEVVAISLEDNSRKRLKVK